MGFGVRVGLGSGPRGPRGLRLSGRRASSGLPLRYCAAAGDTEFMDAPGGRTEARPRGLHGPGRGGRSTGAAAGRDRQRRRRHLRGPGPGEAPPGAPPRPGPQTCARRPDPHHPAPWITRPALSQRRRRARALDRSLSETPEAEPRPWARGHAHSATATPQSWFPAPEWSGPRSRPAPDVKPRPHSGGHAQWSLHPPRMWMPRPCIEGHAPEILCPAPTLDATPLTALGHAPASRAFKPAPLAGFPDFFFFFLPAGSHHPQISPLSGQCHLCLRMVYFFVIVL